MKIGIYSSIDVGLVHDLSIPYIGVDNGLIHLLNQNITPIKVIGDMDSLSNHELLKNYECIKYPAVKDDTDTALALSYAIKEGYTHIDLYGVTKNRLDHFFAVIALLKRYRHIDINIYDEYNKIKILKKGKHKVYKDHYKYFSLFSFEDTIISLSHCLYQLDCYCLKDDNPLCTSNQMLEDYAIIETDKDILFIQSK